MKFVRGIFLFLFVFNFLPGSTARQLFAQTLRADYQFSNTRSSSVVGAPDLTDLGPGSNGFLVDNVRGTIQPVLHFPLGNGLRLTPSTGVLPNDVYTIATLFKMDAGGYRRILDFKNGTSDTGLYIHSFNVLEFFIFGLTSPSGSTLIAPNTYVQVVLTRDSAGIVTCYLNGVQEFQFDDAAGQLAVIDGNNALRFFRDNESGGVTTEHVAGSVARIRIYDDALSAAQVAALEVTNFLASAGSTIVSAGSNGVLDPGETVTVALAVQNIGGPAPICTSSATTGTLQATGGVMNPSPVSQNYDSLCSNGPPASRYFTFQVDPGLPCGALVTASLVLTDGATTYATVTYHFLTGTQVTILSENFDAVAAPALPVGWVAANASGPAPLWVTSTTSPDTAPNDAFVNAPNEVSDKRLDTPSVSIASTTATTLVSFRNNYSLQTYQDGAVLEVSSPNINAGAFTDITDPSVGGSFVSGGYDSTIWSGGGNPLTGRMAWTGNSGGYIDTVAILGANLAGQTIKLRFRMGADGAGFFTGWRIDAVSITEASCVPSLLVTTVADHNDGVCDAADCTLREAITSANAGGVRSIAFAPGVTGTIQLAGLLPLLGRSMTIQGPGANLLTVRRNTGGDYRIFYVTSNVNVTLSGITISTGQTFGADGGGIFNSGNLTLTDCSIAGNNAFNSGSAGGNGSGIYNAIGATLTLVRSTFVNNNCTQFGGGVYNDGILTATNCTFSNNTALRGGGIISRFAGGASIATVRNCTFANNAATDGVGSPGFGGGGLYCEGGAQQHFVSNTIIAGNNATNDPDVRGNYTSDGHNLIGIKGDGVGFTNGVDGDQVGTSASPLNPQLDALANYGGPTQTRALLSTSTARDAGDDVLAPLSDQRRYLRSDVSDIGAFEFNGVPPPTPTPTPTATPIATATPTPINISGTVSYCSNPIPGPVPSVTLTLTGAMSGSTLSDGSGNYTLSSLPSGGNYVVTPTKAAHIPGSVGINTVDVIATQRHFLVVGTPLSGCKLTGADVNTDSTINTVDVIAIQRFFLGNSTGIANTGKYRFTPASTTYTEVSSNQNSQNYNALVFGDVATPFAP